ncbi:MAG: MFS transporter [Anaerolineae bacterium]
MTQTRRILDFFGLRRSVAAMLMMVILVGMGEKLGERFLPIYILALGGGAYVIGLLNALDNLLSALYSYPGGYLSDRLGYKRALAVFNLVSMLGYAIVIFFPSWQAVILGAFFFISWDALSLPATMSLVATVLPKNKRTMGVSMHSLIRRIPMALGPVIGGLLIARFGERDGVRLAFGLAMVLAAVALVFQQRFIEDRRENNGAEGNPLRLARYMSADLRNLLISDILVRFCEQIPYAFAVVYAMKIVGVSSVQFGLLTAIEMATAMLVYVPVAYLADRSGKKPFVAITFLNFTLFPIFLLISHSFWMLVVAFIVRGLKEFGEPTRKALIMDLAPEDRKAAMFGLYYLLRDVIVSFAAFGGAWLWTISPQVNFLVAAAFGAAGTLYFVLFGRDLPKLAGARA